MTYWLAVGTEAGDLEWPWTPLWSPTCAISAIAELLVCLILRSSVTRS